MAKKTLDKCRKGDDFVRYAEKRGAEVIQCDGSHVKVKTPKGICVVSVHSKDTPTGTRHAIIKTFIQIGLAVLVIGIEAMFLLWGAGL